MYLHVSAEYKLIDLDRIIEIRQLNQDLHFYEHGDSYPQTASFSTTEAAQKAFRAIARARRKKDGALIL